MLRLKSVFIAVVLLIATLPSQARYENDQAMVVQNINGIDIAYTEVGDRAAPPVLLIMGLTASHRLWGEEFVNAVADAGYRVILFDNRDSGDSANLDELGTPTLWWEMLKSVIGMDVNAPYQLRDMADDGIALLDELGVDQAHIVGASMGGMIAQIIAAEYPARTTTLVSIMSTTGAPHLPEASNEAQQGLMGMGDAEGDQTAQLHEMGIYPEAMPRQLMAIVAAGDRSERVGSINVPTLVLHGEDDPLLPLAHGEHTAELIEGAKFIKYAGMAHNLPPEVVPALVSDMVGHFGGPRAIQTNADQPVLGQQGTGQ